MNTYRLGNLYVAAARPEERELQRAVMELDPELYVDKEMSAFGSILWSVKRNMGDRPPEPIFWWTDDRGRPLPLAWGIIEKLKSLEGAGLASERAKQANQDLRAEIEKDADYGYEEIARQDVPRLAGTRSAGLQRGQHLRRTRDKQRSRGEKV
jgi:hypothetical protein